MENYKGIQYRFIEKSASLEWIVTSETFSNHQDYIIKMSLFIELAAYLHPEIVIFNKLQTDFELNKHLQDFTRNQYFATLMHLGVKKGIMIVSQKLYDEVYKGIETRTPFLIAFTEYDAAINYIEKL